MVKNKSFQIIVLLIIFSVVILVYVAVYRTQGTKPVPAGETGEQQETAPQGAQVQPVEGEQGAPAPQQEGSAEATQEAVGEEGMPEGAVTGEAAPSP